MKNCQHRFRSLNVVEKGKVVDTAVVCVHCNGIKIRLNSNRQLSFDFKQSCVL